MKKVAVVFLAILTLGIVGCKKEYSCVCGGDATVSVISTDDGTVIASAEIEIEDKEEFDNDKRKANDAEEECEEAGEDREQEFEEEIRNDLGGSVGNGDFEVEVDADVDCDLDED